MEEGGREAGREGHKTGGDKQGSPLAGKTTLDHIPSPLRSGFTGSFQYETIIHSHENLDNTYRFLISNTRRFFISEETNTAIIISI